MADESASLLQRKLQVRVLAQPSPPPWQALRLGARQAGRASIPSNRRAVRKFHRRRHLGGRGGERGGRGGEGERGARPAPLACPSTLCFSTFPGFALAQHQEGWGKGSGRGPCEVVPIAEDAAWQAPGSLSQGVEKAGLGRRRQRPDELQLRGRALTYKADREGVLRTGAAEAAGAIGQSEPSLAPILEGSGWQTPGYWSSVRRQSDKHVQLLQHCRSEAPMWEV